MYLIFFSVRISIGDLVEVFEIDFGLCKAVYTPPLPSGATAMLLLSLKITLPSLVKHGKTPCSKKITLSFFKPK